MSSILGIKEIYELLPQRYPYLMIDRVQLGEETTELDAVKNDTKSTTQK